MVSNDLILEVSQNERFRRRFEENTRKADGCWLWGLKLDRLGYGHIKITSSISAGAHRVAWSIANGRIPDGLDICHTCDNRGCVNPAHLFAATHDENMADMVRKGRARAPRGSASPNSKLHEDQVRNIRSRPSESLADLAREFGVDARTIDFVRQRRNWAHLV